MIKPIETIYKGYRFRSRLEARWAVFFETLGLQWEYEKEGFDCDGTWYLPDFYLPQIGCWVEIKPLTNGLFSDYPDKQIYLAGKIAQDPWRNELLDAQGKIMGWFRNTGPFYLHRESNYENYHGQEAYWEHGATNDSEIYETCIDQIISADVVFGWINTLDCYGTLFELGYAKGVGKEILIGVDTELSPGNGGKWSRDASDWRSDIWFSLESANRWVYASSPLFAFKELTAYLKNIDDKVIKFSKENTILYVCGSPREHMIYIVEDYDCDLKPSLTWAYTWFAYKQSFDAVDNALITAQRSRFEHGEQG